MLLILELEIYKILVKTFHKYGFDSVFAISIVFAWGSSHSERSMALLCMAKQQKNIVKANWATGGGERPTDFDSSAQFAIC